MRATTTFMSASATSTAADTRTMVSQNDGPGMLSKEVIAVPCVVQPWPAKEQTVAPRSVALPMQQDSLQCYREPASGNHVRVAVREQQTPLLRPPAPTRPIQMDGRGSGSRLWAVAELNTVLL